MVKGNTMSDSSERLICYGESLPIARGLAMDAALPKRTLRDICAPPQRRQSGTARKPMATDEIRENEDMDYDMKVKVLAFLREKLDPDDLKKVASLLDAEVDTTGMDLRRSPGASDAALDGEERTLQHRHRAGHITEGQLVTGMRDIRRRRGTIAQDARSVVSPLDKLEAEFPHMNRLKR